MILRVPDYYDEFKCIASNCRDVCCRGWEIDVDEDTKNYYMSLDNEIGDRLRAGLGEAEDGTAIFKLKKNGRCPFLNSANLCDICIKMGEESLSEICTEYPRFGIEYGTVLQKCLSLACEEVGRIIFNKNEPIAIVDYEKPEIQYDLAEDDQEREEIAFLEEVQNKLIEIIENRDKKLKVRIVEFLEYASKAQEAFNAGEFDVKKIDKVAEDVLKIDTEAKLWKDKKVSYENFKIRYDIFNSLETINEEWITFKEDMYKAYSDEEVYTNMLDAFVASDSFRENDYENLMVYFIFRYFMNSVYDNNVFSKAKVAVYCSRFILDMDAYTFNKNGEIYTNVNRIDNAKLFSKEVEHSEENMEVVEDEMNFTDSKDLLM